MKLLAHLLLLAPLAVLPKLQGLETLLPQSSNHWEKWRLKFPVIGKLVAGDFQ